MARRLTALEVYECRMAQLEHEKRVISVGQLADQLGITERSLVEWLRAGKDAKFFSFYDSDLVEIKLDRNQLPFKLTGYIKDVRVYVRRRT